MLSFILVLTLTGSAFAGYAGSSSNSGNQVGGGQGSGSGTGSSYGYSGSFSGNVPPNFAFPQIPQFDFSDFFNRYFDSFRKYHQDFMNNGGGVLSYSYSSSHPSARAKAESSITFDDSFGLQANIQQAQSYGYPGGFPAFAASVGQDGGGGGGYGGSYGGGYGGGFSSTNGQGHGGSFSSPGGVSFGGSFSGPSDGSASASASVGPGGVQQTASVYPENPASPNINTRFGGSPDGGGFHSVFTSSQSHSTNVNGKPQTFQQAQTTVNDNGKVTTYTVKNP